MNTPWNLHLIFALLSLPLAICAGPINSVHAAPPDDGVWTDPEDPTMPVDFHLQGEYVDEKSADQPIGGQVIALGDGAFQAVVYPGGLPGAEADGETKVLLDGRLKDDAVVFKPAQPPKRYLAQSPDEFSAVQDFSSSVQKPWTGTLSKGVLRIKAGDDETYTLMRIERKSPTLGAEPPEDAIVLFDGSNTEHWVGGRADTETGTLHTDRQDIHTRQKFNNYTLHLEFLLPFRPAARGQGRANSGVYQVDQYELQVLDSFGLEGLNNECGGVYTLANPRINMCLPPLTWQTYDIEFTNAVAENGEVKKPAVMTVRHNGVLIHENLKLEKTTGGARNEPMGTPGVIRLQGHGNPLQYRNIWIVKHDQ